MKTFDQFISNAEQMEAHRRDFEVFWNCVLLEVLKEWLMKHGWSWEDERLARYKEDCWQGQLYDAWLDSIRPCIEQL